uniref:Neurocan n=1 Tax=Varanus komodoensis TaxID=61221 RepID=A0A8D2L5Q8_VARKO
FLTVFLIYLFPCCNLIKISLSIRISSLGALSATLGEGEDNGNVITIHKVHHQPLRVGLAEPVALPCLFVLQPSTALGPNEPLDPPRVKWSKVRSAAGLPEDISVLVARDNVVKIGKGYEGRIALPGYPHRRDNATLLLLAARASDAGLYRCEVVAGIHDEQDLVPLEVTGVVFHYRAASNRYALTFPEAQKACEENSAVVLATTGQLHLAWREGLDQCDPGWLADGSVRYPIQNPRKKCGGEEPGGDWDFLGGNQKDRSGS